MKIVIDSHIPFFVEAVQREWPWVQICPMKPEEIDASAVREADVLVVRTRTQVDENLLRESKVQLVCTATIGFDHIDTAYCASRHIYWVSCPGCNAQAVCDYIEECLSSYDIPLSTSTIGIVGVGHVGSLVARMAQKKGMKVLLNDPPKHIGVSLDDIALNSDIITFHTPLIKSSQSSVGTYPTWHLCDEAFLAKCKPGALIINAARGGVVDERALLCSGHPFILDTWENEPDISRDVLAQASLASMHIAGYSVEGKRNASQMCLDAIAEHFGLPKIANLKSEITNHQSGDSAPGWLMRVSEQLKMHPDRFEALRKNYLLR